MRTLPLRMASLLHLLLASLALVGSACGDEGVTPTCDQNADPDVGIKKDADGCHKLPYCLVTINDKLVRADPSECCKDAINPVECAYGYMPLPGSGDSTPGATGSGGNGSSGESDGPDSAGGGGSGD